jgi:hypothetical protein
MIRWFEETDNGWRAIEPLRRTVRFQVQNLLEQPPHPGIFDIVLCRNVLLYLNSERRGLVFDRIADAMASDGWLMLGAGETVIGQTRRFEADVDARGPLPSDRHGIPQIALGLDLRSHPMRPCAPWTSRAAHRRISTSDSCRYP